MSHPEQKPTKVIIAGGRDFNDDHFLTKNLNALLMPSHENEYEIVSGHASGADTLGEQYAENKRQAVKLFPADWKKHGKAAGPIRNREMAQYADCLIAFWDGKSKGTANMIEEMERVGKPVHVCMYYTLDLPKPKIKGQFHVIPKTQ